MQASCSGCNAAGTVSEELQPAIDRLGIPCFCDQIYKHGGSCRFAKNSIPLNKPPTCEVKYLYSFKHLNVPVHATVCHGIFTTYPKGHQHFVSR